MPSSIAAVPPVFSSSSRAAASPVPTPRRPSAFRWSWKLVTIAGIDVHVHATFLLLIALVALSDVIAVQGLAGMLRGTFLILAVFATVVLHELGHALVARRFGVHTRDITLLPIGGVARLDRLPDKPAQQLVVALAGPMVNVVIALLLFGVVRQLGAPVELDSVNTATAPFLTQLMWINVSLAVFNLLPGYPMDGGRILRALLAMRLPPERATQIAARVGQGVAVVFGMIGVLISPFLMVIAAFVWVGAQAEHSMSTVKVALDGLSVRDGMITNYQALASSDSVARAVYLTLASFQQDFPVMDGGRLVGILTHADLLKAVAEHGQNVPVHQAMCSTFETAHPAEALSGALTRMHRSEGRVLMVVQDDVVVGLLTPGNIGELLALEAADRHAKVVGAQRTMNSPDAITS